MPVAKLKVPEDAWEADGGRLLATVEIFGVPHHLEAIPVRKDDTMLSPRGLNDMRLESYRKAFEPQNQWLPVMIDGKRYVLFLEPFSW